MATDCNLTRPGMRQAVAEAEAEIKARRAELFRRLTADRPQRPQLSDRDVRRARGQVLSLSDWAPG